MQALHNRVTYVFLVEKCPGVIRQHRCRLGRPLNNRLLNCLTPLVEQVKKQLFGLDKRGMGVEVAMKNELRRTIMVGLDCACVAFLGGGICGNPPFQ